MPVPTADFLAGMRRLAGGVTIVTARLGDLRAGMTATSVCSLTAEPPQLLVCVHRDADAYGLILESGYFAVNVLTREQQDLADHFGGRDRSHGPTRFSAGHWVDGATGVPVLVDAGATFECRLIETLAASTHSIFIGEVEAVGVTADALGLVYHDRTYHRLGGLQQD